MAPRSKSKSKSRRSKGASFFTSFWFKAAIVLLVLGAIGALVGPRTYRYFRDQRIDSNLEGARVALRSEKWSEAKNLSRSVLIARPGEFDAFRIYHAAMAEINDPETYIASIQLFMNPLSNEDDRLAALRVLGKDAPQAVALAAFSSLETDLLDNVEFRAAIVPLLLHRGEFRIAEGLLREGAGLESSAVARLELIRALCAYPASERVAEARQLAAALIEEDAPEGLEAILVLGNSPGGLAPGAPLPDLTAWVETQPQATTLHHLTARQQVLLEFPERKQEIIQLLIDRFLDVDPGIVGNWMVSQGESERVIRLLEEPAKTSATAYMARVRAMSFESTPAEVDAELQSPPRSVDQVDLEIIRTTIAIRRKDLTAAKVGWERVLQQAAFDQSRNRFLEIHQYAKLLGQQEVADDAMIAAIRIGWGRIPLYQELSDLRDRLLAQNRTADLMAVCRTLLKFETGNFPLQVQFAHLGMLHEVITPSEAKERLQSVLAADPELYSAQGPLALACVLDGSPQLALDLLAAEAPSDEFPLNLRRAVKGAALIELEAEGGGDGGGLAEIQALDWSRLLRQQAKILRSHLAKLKNRNLKLPADTFVSLEDPAETPAWRKAVEELEKQREGDTLPPLPVPKMPKDYELKPLVDPAGNSSSPE